MPESDFAAFFHRATQHEPYTHQCGLGLEPFTDTILIRPTAAGKTAEVTVAWLWRLSVDPRNTPRRLVYCLPTRALVKQTIRAIEGWRDRVAPEIAIYALLGGAVDQDWEKHPEKPAVIVGTQDLLISRALNRGYAMSRYRWPIAFGLLNNDSIWVLDEVQLMGAGLPTTAQLAAFRKMFGVLGPASTIWMSATLDPKLLATVDFARALDQARVLRLGSQIELRLAKRISAKKRLAKALTAARTPEGLAAFVAREHRPGAQTLVVVNRVARAVETYIALRKVLRGDADGPELLLIHSRYRPPDREKREEALQQRPGHGGRIIVSTQVIEAGVDIDSELLITDLAPYSSLVQRFGRSNRAGEVETSRIFWVDRPLTSKQAELAELNTLDEKQQNEVAAPYSWAELAAAAAVVGKLQSAAAVDLPEYKAHATNEHVLRRRDLLDLFDTSRDLSGFDIDVSRFVRGGEEQDVFVAWRAAAEAGSQPRNSSRPRPEEMCPIPAGELRTFVKKPRKGAVRRVWTWDALAGEWEAIHPGNVDRRVRSGAIYVIDSGAGGYDLELGWQSGSTAVVPEIGADSEGVPEEAMDGEELVIRRRAQTLEAHSRLVREALEHIVRDLGLPELQPFEKDLIAAALSHDVGKAHPVFRKAVGVAEGVILAKSTERHRYERPHFRHEMASALAVIGNGGSDLAAYLVAAHHGKVRLSIRSLPGEIPPEETDRRFACGVYEGERLPALRIDGWQMPETTLDLSVMQLGGAERPSWTDRMLRLRDQLGPFRLAYIEALLRVSDWRASDEADEVLR